MIVTYILSLAAIVLTYFVTGSASSACMGVFILMVCTIACRSVAAKSRNYAYILFNIVFTLTTILILIRYDYMNSMPDLSNYFKSGIDQSELYEKADFAQGYNSYNRLLSDTFKEFIENQGYYLYIRTLSFLGYNYFDGNHVVLQMMGSSLFGCLLTVVLYNIFLLYFKPSKSLFLTLTLFLLSPTLQYSIYLLRDIHVTLIYAVITYILIKEYKTSNYLWLALCVTLAWLIRPQHGMFTLIFVALYYYKGNKRNAGQAILVGSMVVVGLSVFFLDHFFTELTDTMTFYEMRTAEMAKDNISFAFISNLPQPFKQIGQIVVYTFFPVNVWIRLGASFDHIYAFLDTLMSITGKLFWFFVMWLLLKWIFEKKLGKIEWIFGWIFAVAAIFYLLNASDMSVRRTMCIYPALFTMFAIIKEKHISKSKYKKEILVPTIFFAVTSFAYTLMK